MQTKVETTFTRTYLPLVKLHWWSPWRKVVRTPNGYEIKPYHLWGCRDALANRDDAFIRLCCFEGRWKLKMLEFEKVRKL